MFLKVVNFKSWLTTEGPDDNYLPLHHSGVDTYENTPAEFQEMLGIRVRVNTLLNQIDDMDRVVWGLKKKKCVATPEKKEEIRRIRRIVATGLAELASDINNFTVTFFTARYLHSCTVGYWESGNSKKAIKTIRKVLDLIESPDGYKSYSVLLFVSDYFAMLGTTQEWGLLQRFISWVELFTALPLAQALGGVAKGILAAHQRNSAS